MFNLTSDFLHNSMDFKRTIQVLKHFGGPGVGELVLNMLGLGVFCSSIM